MPKNGSPITSEDLDRWCAEVVEGSHNLVRRFCDIGRAVNAKVTDGKSVQNRFTRLGVSTSSAPVYVSNAKRIARLADAHKAFATQISKGISKDDALGWGKAIEVATESGEKVPTFAQWKTAQRSKSQTKKAKKNESQSRKRSGSENPGNPDNPKEPNTPTTWADLLPIVQPMFDATAKASGDPLAFWQNVVRWAGSEYEIRHAAKNIKSHIVVTNKK
jgi:hypothetical protein